MIPVAESRSDMSVADVLRRHFASDVRLRGADYYANGRVRGLSGSKDEASALVRGTRNYDVYVQLAGGEVRIGCTCPYVLSYELPCKHAWAVVLAADAVGLLRSALSRPPGRADLLKPEEPAPELADDDDDAVEEGDDEGQFNPRRHPASSRPSPALENLLRRMPELRAKLEAARRLAAPARADAGAAPAPAQSAWEKLLRSVRDGERDARSTFSEVPKWPPGRELIYVIDLAPSRDPGQLSVAIETTDLMKGGTRGRPKSLRILRRDVPLLPDSADRRILSLLEGAHGAGAIGLGYGDVESRRLVAEPLQATVLAAIAATGRCRLRRSPEADAALEPVAWDGGEPFSFVIEVAADPEKERSLVARGVLRRGDERWPAEDVDLLLGGGVFIHGGVAARADFSLSTPWLRILYLLPRVPVPSSEGDRFVNELLSLPNAPPLELPAELRFEEVRVAPRPHAVIRAPRRSDYSAPPKLAVELAFEYGDTSVKRSDPRSRIAMTKPRRAITVRDRAAEEAAVARLVALGVKSPPSYRRDANDGLELAPSRLHAVVAALAAEGWRVEADGRLYRPFAEMSLDVTTGVDWFDLAGAVRFDGAEASLPELLVALRRKERFVRLGDGTFGILPEEWLSRLELVTRLGVPKDEALRFAKTQVSFLDALLATQPSATWDDAFSRAREKLGRFEGVKAADPPKTFRGELRPYQREGLGWLHFLRDFGFGGCLADDMGLGKTVQVLALLDSRRGSKKKPPRPSLVVVPRSLVFNWKSEAAKFTPELDVLDHTGIDRDESGARFGKHDVVLTTYGTLRRDIEWMKDVPFDYVILDESQAIKNQATGAAKSALLLKSEHRLAMSGTPIENHLGELWSLFEFLNPGLLGTSSAFRETSERNPAPESRALLAKALRPFVLRRKKEDVAKDLPEKLEQTLFCELEPGERRLYDELRDHYRRSLLERVAKDGLEKSKIHVLEALLRLRQAACHPGLVDKTRVAEGSAKIDLVLEQLAAVREEGHKAIVFSQFTSLLAILRSRLDLAGVTYDYLDGATRDRQARVERFQTDPKCPLFLVSLKAGGVGLNLTAAEYVYLLDPWWNPAVESQAIDRAHRIGQTRRVFAYRVIARETIEERVLELQAAKRALADAIIGESSGLLRDLTREDLERLLA